MAAVRLAHRDEGPREGRPIVLLHGSPTDRRIWAPQAKDLAAAGYRVVTADLRGHGESPLGDKPTSLATYADDVMALVNELDLEAFVLGGFSYGGWVAMEIVHAHAGRVAGLLLVSTGAQPDTAKEAAMRPAQAAEIRAHGVKLDGYAERILTRETLARRPDVWSALRASMAAVSAEGRARAVEAMAGRPDFRKVLPEVSVPALVIAGAEDPITPPALAKEMHRLIPGCFMQIVEGASHGVTLEAPGIVTQSILNWLAFSGLDSG
jgi:pimeloyl-ACP methyl ester carboxylesterase